MTTRTDLIALTWLILVIAYAQPARAETIVLDCMEQTGGATSSMTITFAGDTKGSVEVAAPFGKLILPASLERTQLDVDGKKITQTGIRAFGEAKVLMPAKAALEACIVAKRSTDETDDILGLLACQQTVAREETVITATLEVAMHEDGAPPFVYLTRTYLEATADYLNGSGATSGRIAIDSVPPPQCTRVQ